jgi:hypothetical protein
MRPKSGSPVRAVRATPVTGVPTARDNRAIARPMPPGAHDHDMAPRKHARLAMVPVVLALVGERGVKILGEDQHHPEDMLGDGPVEHATGVGHDHVAVDESWEHHHVDACARGVDPANPLRSCPRLAQQ